MLEGLRTAAAGMQAQQQKLDAVSNDLANANTNGYKRLRVGFSDLLYEQGGRPTTSDDAQLGTGSRAVSVGRTFQQGSLRETANPLDVAPPGRGLHQGQARRRPPGPDARRRPAHRRQPPPRDQLRRLRPAADHDPRGRRARARSRSAATAPSSPPARTSARSASPTCARRTNLQSVGDNAFVTTDRSGNAVAAPAATVLKQGALEASNTDMSQSMTEMIEVQRTYQLTSKAIQTADR